MSTNTVEKFLSPEQTVLTDVGPCLHEDGVTYRVWCYGHRSVVVEVEKASGEKYRVPLEQAKDSGYFFGLDARGTAGDLYKIVIDGAASVPDLASHYQPQGVFGPSMLVDAGAFKWQAQAWERPPYTGRVIYECHVGTFTQQGTFRSAIEKLDHLVSLGINALEIMPVADWAGERNWGYDGVMLFAPAHCYGSPDDFRALIDACHLRGLAVILDIVYNHLGPEGNFSHQYSDYFFHEGKDNPWGQNFNVDGANSEPVRAFLRQNMRYWLSEFRIDGFRMDATHAVHDESPVHILAEVAEIVHDQGGFIIAEDDRNSRMLMEPRDKNGWNFDALWSDDFHHSIRVSQTGEQEYFLSMFKGTAEEIAKIMRRGWLYSGEYSSFHKKNRGTPADDFPPQSFVFCISNHDQVGNRFQGERFHETINPAGYRALSLFLCLVPYTPLIFMGQEWGVSNAFHYFTDMSEELGNLIFEGRKKELLEMKFVTDPAEVAKMSHPQAEKTFLESKLNWSEVDQDGHRRLLELYRSGLKLRRELFPNGNPPRSQWQVKSEGDSVTIEYRVENRRVSVCFCLKAGSGNSAPEGRILLRSNAPDVTAEGEAETIVTELS
jgi:maltooligosyltrehalose trehalohydrolase